MPNAQQSDEILSLISKLKLPDSYLNTINLWLRPIAKEIAQQLPSSNAPTSSTQIKTMVLGVQGAQGSGKSTCSEFLKAIFESEYQLKTAVLSIDDFYLTLQEREALSEQVHPLLKTRGVPGTHDVNLAMSTITHLKSLKNGESTPIVRFNKAIDDRAEKSEWDTISGPVDIIILEGWFTGLAQEKNDDLTKDINSLESEEDQNGIWREYVNQQLSDSYTSLFNLIDKLLVLKAPSFDCVYQWRLKQEEKLIAAQKNTNQKLKTLSPLEVKRFIAHFERLTKHALNTLPDKADWCLHLDENQTITQQTRKMPAYIIFTDLDGTLLDHYSYSWEAANPAIERAQSLNIPIIINTSKTRPEVIELQKRIGLTEPFIIENGSALYIPKRTLNTNQLTRLENEHKTEGEYIEILFGKRRTEIVNTVYKLRDEFGFNFSGYTDWDVNKLMEITGLDEASAKQSMAREFSEPLVWDDSDENYVVFTQHIDRAGYKILKGGRFIHILGKTNKANPMLYFMHELLESKEYKSICLGDSPNDIDMLNAADYPVCVKSPTASYPQLKAKEWRYNTEGIGPEGWNEAIQKILDTQN